MLWKKILKSHQSHIRGGALELSVHDEGDAVGLKQVLEVGDVLGVLVAVLRQAGHLGPPELLQDFKIGVPAANDVIKIL